ncbi:MAG TPA: ABC transporter permease [Solirubrobacteraceae bacterium]|nr:ABC transporter permease [Solirubrobacteraceae bacterium]
MRWLLLKDLRILRRSPVMVGVLVLYPAVIGLLVGFALSSPPARPKVAIYSGVRPGHSVVALGGQRIDVAAYAADLYGSVTPVRAASPAAAVADVRDGRALAALIIPPGIVDQIRDLIRTGDGNPTVRIVLNDRNPLERDLVQQAIQSRVAQVQADVSKQVLQTVISDLRLVLSGGTLNFLGHSFDLLGLQNTRTIVSSAVSSLGPASPLSPALGQVVRFADLAIDGLTLAGPQISQVSTPLTVDTSELSGRTTPTASYAAAIAAVVLLMFVTLLLAAGMLALERSESTYGRLIGGLVRPPALLAEKVLLAVVCALPFTFGVSAAISAFVALDWGRAELWLLALAVGALAFAALGVAVGALARDVSVASLLAFLIGLPVAFIALVPAAAVSSGVGQVLNVISFVFPFHAALEAVNNAFTGSAPGLGLPLLHLVVLAGVFGLLARVALVRFGER